MIKNAPASLGERLKYIREEAGLSVENLAKTTRIQAKYLRHLENEELDKLPPPVYIKGFLQRWAQVCGVEADDLLLQFYRENKFLTRNQQDQKISSVFSPSFIITSKHLVLTFGIIIAAVITGYFYYNQILVFNTPRVEIVSPREFSSVSHEDSIFIRGEARGTIRLHIDGTEVFLDEGGIFEHLYYLQSGLNTIIITAEGNNDENIEVIRKVLKLE